MKFFLLILIGLTQVIHAEEIITPEDTFLDLKTGKYLHICEKEGDALVVKEACGKYWDKFPRVRTDLAKQVNSYKDLTKNSTVMIKVKKSDGEFYWILGTVSFMYENGRVDVMEYYDKRFGYNVGTTTWHTSYDIISKAKTNGLKKICAKEDFEINYDYDNGRKFTFKKGDELILNQVYENNIASITLNNKMENFFRYGHNNQLPVSMDKLMPCEATVNISIDDTTRGSKEKTNTDVEVVDRFLSTAKEK